MVTVNDYLARRDSEWVGQVHRFLGLAVGLIQADLKPEQRRAAYACDVTYVTNSELGFDYLRDNLAAVSAGRDYVAACRGRPHSCCVAGKLLWEIGLGPSLRRVRRVSSMRCGPATSRATWQRWESQARSRVGFGGLGVLGGGGDCAVLRRCVQQRLELEGAANPRQGKSFAECSVCRRRPWERCHKGALPGTAPRAQGGVGCCGKQLATRVGTLSGPCECDW